MRVTIISELPGVNQGMYDQVARELGDPKQWGVISHIAGPVENGWRVIEVWESEEKLHQFFQNERVQRVFQQAHIPPVRPAIFPVYRMVGVEDLQDKAL